MTPSFWTYHDPRHFTAYFRGFVKVYNGSSIERIACTEVRQNRREALSDAKKLVKKLKNEKLKKADGTGRNFAQATAR